MPSSKTRIAIVGGGVAGLVVLRHVLSKLDTYNPTLFEQTDQIGGTWVYTDETDVDKHGLMIHSSMYKNLKRHTHYAITGKQAEIEVEKQAEYCISYVSKTGLRMSDLA